MTQRRRPGATSISTAREQALAAPRATLHPHLRRALKIYQWLFGFIVVGVILAAPVIVLVQDGTRNYLPNLINQIAALWAVVVAYPLPAVLVTLALLILLGLSVRADAESAAEARAAAQQAAAAAGATAAQHEMDAQAPKMAQQISEAVAPPVQIAAAGGAYAGAWVAIGEATPRMANSVAATVVEQLQENLKIAVEAGQSARIAAPPLPAGVVTTSGLPRPRELFGRAPQTESLLRALTSGGAVNVCAVEGLPGIGKTALAAEAVALAVERSLFPSAIWLSAEGKRGDGGMASIWIDLANLLGEQDIVQMSDANRQRAKLRATLASPDRAPLLIALDNVEPDLPPGYADTLAQTLTGPKTALLVTARQALDSPLVRPFPLDRLDNAAAQALFRAQLQLRASERPTPEEVDALPAIIKELDGLALALQLTADYASVQRRPLPALLDQLRREGVVGGPLAKLTASIDRSWAILTPTQRLLLAGLALLDGSSFPRAAALAVAGAAAALASPGATADAPGDETGSDALDALVGLSLVEPLTNERMRLHPLLREYAAERLHSDTPSTAQETLGSAAFSWWLDFAEDHPGYEGMAALEDEAEGLMLALTWAHDQQKHRDTLALADALSRFWFVRGRVADARIARPWALAAAEALGDPSESQWAYHELAVLARQTGDLAAARQGFEQALRLATELGDKSAMGTEIYSLAQIAESEEAREEGYQTALALAQELSDPAMQSRILTALGVLHMRRQGDNRAGRVRDEFVAALRFARQVEQPDLIAEAAWWLAEVDRLEGDTTSACAGFREALAIYERLQHPDAQITRERLQSLGCG